jgi:hypothetical protein
LPARGHCLAQQIEPFPDQRAPCSTAFRQFRRRALHVLFDAASVPGSDDQNRCGSAAAVPGRHLPQPPDHRCSNQTFILVPVWLLTCNTARVPSISVNGYTGGMWRVPEECVEDCVPRVLPALIVLMIFLWQIDAMGRLVAGGAAYRIAPRRSPLAQPRRDVLDDLSGGFRTTCRAARIVKASITDRPPWIGL